MFKHKLLLAITFTLPCFTAVADVVEWAPFIINDNTEMHLLIRAADAVNEQFLAKQKGFIRRELVKKSEYEYADIVYWKSLEDAKIAGFKVETCNVCLEYFSSMDMKASAKSGAGFSHYEIIKSW